MKTHVRFYIYIIIVIFIQINVSSEEFIRSKTRLWDVMDTFEIIYIQWIVKVKLGSSVVYLYIEGWKWKKSVVLVNERFLLLVYMSWGWYEMGLESLPMRSDYMKYVFLV